MLNREIAIDQSLQLINELRKNGYHISKAMLFGSTIKGNIHEHSDIDLAIWDDKFTGCLSIDYEPIKNILHKFCNIELHTFDENETPGNNPFVKEIYKVGAVLV